MRMRRMIALTVTVFAMIVFAMIVLPWR